MRLNLTSGFYKTRSLIGDAQRALNLYGEPNQKESQVEITTYPTPGLSLLATIGTGPLRGAYTASNGVLYVVSGNGLYSVSGAWTAKLLQTILTTSGPVSMKDNGLTMILVDGSTTGYRVTLSTNAVTLITSTTDANWRAASKVDLLDGYFILNQVGTRLWFISDIEAATFSNPLYFASKEGNSDPLVTLVVVHREIWLFGTDTVQLFFNAGAPDFPFQIMPGIFMQFGCAAPASIATHDLSPFWLGRNDKGQYIVFMGVGYQAKRISTHAIEEQLATYGDVSQAIGYCYQQEGHPFYVLTFPGADATWVFDIDTGLWHERGYMDASGVVHRHLSNCHAFAYGKNVVGDYRNGNLYWMDPSLFDDAGSPILRLRSFPTIDLDDDRVIYDKLTLDLQTGVGQATGTWQNPTISVRWSDDGGNTWENAVQVAAGAIGQFMVRAMLRRMGYGRRRVFEVSWASPLDTALNGAWLDYRKAAS